MTIKNQDLQSIFKYWESLILADGTRRWSDFDVLMLPSAAWSRIMLVDVIDDDCKFRVRLVGTYITDAIGRDPTGKRFVEEEAPGITQTRHLWALHEVLRTQDWQYYHGESTYRMRDDYHVVEMICLPFYNGENAVSVILTAFDYVDFECKYLLRDGSDQAEAYPIGARRAGGECAAISQEMRCEPPLRRQNFEK